MQSLLYTNFSFTQGSVSGLFILNYVYISPVSVQHCFCYSDFVAYLNIWEACLLSLLFFFKIDLALFRYCLVSYTYLIITLFKILNLGCFYILSRKILKIYQRENWKNSLMNSHGLHHQTSKITNTVIFVLCIAPHFSLLHQTILNHRYNIMSLYQRM